MTAVLLFNGWGMDEHAVAHLDDGREVVVIAPQAVPSDLAAQWQGRDVAVVAWSMGVWAANRWLCAHDVQVSQSIAINGTPFGIDDQRGIPCALFAKTAANLNEVTRRKFYQRVFTQLGAVQDDYDHFLPHSEVVVQQQALEDLLAQSGAVDAVYPWQHAWIARGDRIFSPDNQRAGWAGSDTTLHVVDGAHHLLRQWSSWQALFDDCR
ncbi:DUF452 family protein [Cardiobacteriaceae bacterium TAE3-ERU3]|nr:DUF452 family protein [Cardiobacteriaceae bacterium TAE3-ERU3]